MGFAHDLSVIFQGFRITVEVTVGGIILATLDAFVAGLLSRSPFLPVRFVVRAYVEGWRGSSELVQLFVVFFALPELVGLRVAPLWAGIIVLGLNVGAYGAEVVRGAVDAVPKPQHEGAVALSLGPLQRLRLVMLPQALVEMVPSFNTLFIQLLQASTLVSLIFLADMTYQAKDVLGSSQPITSDPLIYGVLLIIYVALAAVLTALMRLLEIGLARYAGRPATRNVSMRTIIRPALWKPRTPKPVGS